MAGVAERLGNIDHRGNGGEVVIEAALAPGAVPSTIHILRAGPFL